ncbi:MAG: DMT family transporter [Pseudophaeobacter sp. bin_em_oilr2.035]|nr:DMT family transporter [Phaeobacter gallaeciensis]MDF1770418.1 DMT family transporter [Pseudophaeobacter sp. bin_em_oilr2.035]MDE4143245.1 DMT family transporter [Phaeobacter gallaeciensis]MDE4160581.1 DMT family transporter [Phaeobacter gallaeciensis]MDE4169034.1 DMT family transporter [Phaeobacter gallaeciensis]MDE4177560.1 DMT family transporter [Phaeobacter gallaeciensis]
MTEKRSMDAAGALALTGFAALLGFNQVVIKIANGGFGPVFQAGLRSLIALAVILIWVWLRRSRLRPEGGMPAGIHGWGIVVGLLFTGEFICLFWALDVSSVSRVTIIFNSMPVWLALAAHLWLPGERLSGLRVVGLVLAMGGVVLAVLDRDASGASVLGDVLALISTLCWAGLAFCVRATPLSRVPAVTQLIYQLAVSAVLLLALSPLFGPLLRAPEPIHIAGVLFQAIAIASLGYLLWFWLFTIYKAGSVASFSFLSPVLAVVMGWLILGERLSYEVWLALALVAAGVFLINRPDKRTTIG